MSRNGVSVSCTFVYETKQALLYEQTCQAHYEAAEECTICGLIGFCFLRLHSNVIAIFINCKMH